MRSEVLTADSNGVVGISGGAGLIIEPYGNAATYPVNLHFNGNPNVADVVHTDRPYTTTFNSAQLRGVTPQSQWLVTTWLQGESVGAIGSRKSVLLARCYVPTAVNDGVSYLTAASTHTDAFGSQEFFDVSRYKSVTALVSHEGQTNYSMGNTLALQLGLRGAAGDVGEDVNFGSSNDFAGNSPIGGHVCVGEGIATSTGTHTATRGVRWPGRVSLQLSNPTGGPLIFTNMRVELWGNL